MNTHKVKIIKDQDDKDEVIKINESQLLTVERVARAEGIISLGIRVGNVKSAVEIRGSGSGSEYKGKALYLSSSFNWVITKDGADILCLVPYRK